MKKTLILTGAMLMVISAANAQLATRTNATTAKADIVVEQIAVAEKPADNNTREAADCYKAGTSRILCKDDMGNWVEYMPNK
ncbi:MAG: hypothetical protein FWG39_02475 [Alphaproteobacteria bacterium]|nr:hypothetical protein [Alphaproteobacteria bacterium]